MFFSLFNTAIVVFTFNFFNAYYFNKQKSTPTNSVSRKSDNKSYYKKTIKNSTNKNYKRRLAIYCLQQEISFNLPLNCVINYLRKKILNQKTIFNILSLHEEKI